MRRRKIDTIARHFWRRFHSDQRAADYFADRLYALEYRQPTRIQLVRASLRIVEPTLIGTWFAENMIMHFEYERVPDRTIENLLLAGVRGDVLVEVLSGVWPNMLQQIDAGARLEGLVTDRQREWLVDPARQIGPPIP